MVIRVYIEKYTFSQKLKEFIVLAAPINTSSSILPASERGELSPVYVCLWCVHTTMKYGRV
jgi:hypothetical protein